MHISHVWNDSYIEKLWVHDRQNHRITESLTNTLVWVVLGNLTTSPVTIEKIVSDNFLMTLYQVCRLLLALAMIEYVPKKYKPKVKLEINRYSKLLA